MDTFDNGLFGFDLDSEDQLNDEQGNLFTGGSFRDSTLFLVDCTQSMFVKREDEPEQTLFQKCMKAIQNVYQNKIYGSDKDFLGIVFFGTKKNNTGEDFLHIYQLQDLDQPSAERIKQIEKLSIDFDLNEFGSSYGHSEDFALDKVLWWCSNMFSVVTQKLDSKRILLFTRRDHPHESNKTLERMAKSKAKDLIEIGIAIEIVPVIEKGETFDYSKFYGDLLMLTDENLKLIPDPAETFDELEKTLRSKNHKKRPYTNLSLIIGENMSISCSVYNLVRECPKPYKIKLDKKTNVETKSVTRRYIPETGEILFNSDTKLAIDVCDKRVTFEQDEVKSIKRFSNPGLKLLGFKAFDTIKPYMFIKPGHFLYPDEKHIEGSTTLFKCLVDRCLAKERYILCEMIARVNTPPRLVALLPQLEELDEHRIQVTPPGFHVFYLPFADDIRQIDRKIKSKTSPEFLELFGRIVNKLKFKYVPEDFKNPALQKLWSEIEAIALAREEAEQIIDLTIPDAERIEKRAGQFLDEFAKHFNLVESGFAKGKRKNLQNDDSGASSPKKAKANVEINLENEAKTGKLDKLTVPQLKESMKSNSISYTGATKKDDLIKLVKKHFKVK